VCGRPDSLALCRALLLTAALVRSHAPVGEARDASLTGMLRETAASQDGRARARGKASGLAGALYATRCGVSGAYGAEGRAPPRRGGMRRANERLRQGPNLRRRCPLAAATAAQGALSKLAVGSPLSAMTALGALSEWSWLNPT
jgi:hypothetical protein